jgi:hypothetical protein
VSLRLVIEIVDAPAPRGVKRGYRDCEPWLLAIPSAASAPAATCAALLAVHYLATTSSSSSAADLVAVGLPPLRYAHVWDFACAWRPSPAALSRRAAALSGP